MTDYKETDLERRARLNRERATHDKDDSTLWTVKDTLIHVLNDEELISHTKCMIFLAKQAKHIDPIADNLINPFTIEGVYCNVNSYEVEMMLQRELARHTFHRLYSGVNHE